METSNNRSSVHDHIKADIKLPSPPVIAVRILEAVKNEETSFDELTSIIATDPALSAKILRVANSPFYAQSSKVDNIQKALAIIGFDALKNIALSFVIAKELRGASAETFDFDFFWKRAVTAAVSGDLIADLTGNKTNDIFVTTLLQDIGVVIMYLSSPDEYMKVMDEKRANRLPVAAVETEIFGFDHQELGMEALKQWGLPSSIYQPIGSHHFIDGNTSGHTIQSEILMLSDMMSSIYHGTRSAEKMQTIKEVLTSRYGIDESKIESLVDSVAGRSVEIMSFFEIDPGNMKPFSLMLQEANEELGKLNFSYEQLVIELKQAKETAERLARELQTANNKLRGMAFRDGLTNLYNHRYFQEHLEKEVSKAIRYKRPFSLIIFDLDHFKRINDTYGHPVGDVVLKEVSALVEKTVRISDVVTRYGGEEFTVTLPETPLKGAVILAERLRQGVEQLEINTGDQIIKVTISVGLTTWEPGSDVQKKVDIIDAADRALYKSKKTGRNKTSYARASCSS